MPMMGIATQPLDAVAVPLGGLASTAREVWESIVHWSWPCLCFKMPCVLMWPCSSQGNAGLCCSL